MRRTQLFCAIGVSLWSVMMSGSQTVPVTVSAQLKAHVQNERFDIITSIRGLPLGVRDRLETLFGNRGLDIAEPGAEFQRGRAGADSRIPPRRLVAAGCSSDYHCLVYYERGGASQTWRALLFHWTPNSTRLEMGGTAPGGLMTVSDVQRAILSGAIRDSGGLW